MTVNAPKLSDSKNESLNLGNMKKQLTATMYLLILLVLFCSCLKIDTVHQPIVTSPGDTVRVVIEIHSEGTDSNPQAVFFTVLIPNDWKTISLHYQSAKFGNGRFEPSQYWADSCEVVYPSGSDYTWWGFLTRKSFLADENNIRATLLCSLYVGQKAGEYQLGYTLGEDALGFDTSWGNVYDFSFDNPIRVIHRINVPEQFSTIQQGIHAADSGMIVKVAAGTYYEHIFMKPEVIVEGSGAKETIINGAITADPLFIGGEPFDYQLTENSPCIDAGNPNGPFDEDGTVADLGAFYFHQQGIPSTIRYIYLVHFTHLDIGFTDPQDVVAERYKKIIDKAISYADNIPTYKWTIESIWQLEQWLNRSTQQEIEHLQELINAGKIAVCAGYATMHTAVLGTEEINRFLYPAEYYRQKFGFDLSTILQNDVPGYCWSLPSVLANAGIKYMATGINSTFVSKPELPIKHNPFYWQGPDGKKVLTWISYGSYVEWWTVYQMSHINTFYQALLTELKKYEAAEYPYDAIMIMCGSIENTEPSTLFTGMTSLWNKTYANPKLIVGKADDFFSHLKEKYGDQFETYSGDWSGAWDIISLNVPQSMAMNRLSHDRITTAEKLASINAIINKVDYPMNKITAIYKNMLQFDEHSGGGAPWPGSMTQEEAQRQSEIAYNYAKNAYDSSNYLIDIGLETLSNIVQTDEPSIIVFNPLSWERTEVVKIKLNAEWLHQPFQLIDANNNSRIKYQLLDKTSELLFIAPHVPAFGYKIFKLTHDQHLLSSKVRLDSTLIKRSPTTSLSNPTIENEYYRVVVTSDDGHILSIFDKQDGRELVNTKSDYVFNGCIKATGMQAARGAYEPIPSGVAQIESFLNGEVAQFLAITRVGSPFVKTEIWLYKGIKRIEIMNTLNRNLMDWVPQSINHEYYAFTFPFDLPNFSVYLEGANGFWNPAYDHLPGAPRGFFAIQHGGCITNGGYHINWANREAFVVEFEHFHGLTTTFSPVEATLLSRIIKKEDEGKFLDGSIGQIVPEPGASNLIINNYAFSGEIGNFDATESAHFGWGFSNPFIVQLIDKNPHGTLPDTGLSFFKLNKSNVMLINVKQSDWGNGTIFRLLEIAGKTTTVTLSSNNFRWSSAYITNSVEQNISPATIINDKMQLTLNPHEIKTLRANLTYLPVLNNRQHILPKQFKLFQNYPNPFNPSTTINYQLPENCHVKIQILNITGQTVKVLVDEQKSSGQYSVHWNGTNRMGQQVTSGIYFYQMKTDKFFKQRKLLLLK